jgi:hypothetical protein
MIEMSSTESQSQKEDPPISRAPNDSFQSSEKLINERYGHHKLRILSLRWSRIVKEAALFLSLIGVASLLLVLTNIVFLPDPALSPLLTSTAMIMFIIAIIHLTRILLFPRLDLQALIFRAAETSVGAGIAAAAIIYLLGILIQSVVILLQ